MSMDVALSGMRTLRGLNIRNSFALCARKTADATKGSNYFHKSLWLNEMEGSEDQARTLERQKCRQLPPRQTCGGMAPIHNRVLETCPSASGAHLGHSWH